MQVNIHTAKTNLSQLIERVQAGEEVIIAKSGRPVARLTPIRKSRKRVFGSAARQIVFHRGWDAAMSEADLREMLGE